MKKIVLIGLCSLILLLSGCTDSKKSANTIVFATSADYPPFEYKQYGETKGFDIDLAHKVAEQMGKKAEFRDMQFSTVLPALQTGQADAAISTLTITNQRKENFDFSKPYYFEVMAMVFPKKNPVPVISEFKNKKIAYQLGSVMEIWLKQHASSAKLIAMDNNNQAIEALKVGHVDYVLLDGAQAHIFSQKNPELSYSILDHAKDGYGIAVKKGSPLLKEINQALQTLQEKGDIEALKKKWLNFSKS